MKKSLWYLPCYCYPYDDIESVKHYNRKNIYEYKEESVFFAQFMLCSRLSACPEYTDIYSGNFISIVGSRKGELKYIYYGAKLSDRDFQTIGSLDKGKYAAYPVYGLNCPSEVALAVKHNDGNMTLQLEVVKVESSHQDEVNLTIISLKDKVYPFM